MPDRLDSKQRALRSDRNCVRVRSPDCGAADAEMLGNAVARILLEDVEEQLPQYSAVPAERPLLEVARKAIVGSWRGQADCGQAYWESFSAAGEVGEELAREWAGEVWGREVAEE